MTTRPRTRVEEIRRARGMSQAELARQAGLLPQTLHKIEAGGTKDVSAAARKQLAPPLSVSEEQLVMPIGSPIPPLGGFSSSSIDNQVLKDVLVELKEFRLEVRELLTRLIERG